MSFSSYIDKIDGVFSTYRAKAAEIEAALESAQKAATAAKNDKGISAERKAVAAEDFKEAQRKHNTDLVAAQDAAKRELGRLRVDLEADIRAFTTVDTSRIDATTIALLNSGALTDTDLVSLAKQNSTNTTALKLIGKSAENMKDTSTTAAALSVKIADFVGATSRLSVFDAASYTVSRGLAPMHLATAIGNYWDSAGYEQNKAAMAQMDAFTVD